MPNTMPSCAYWGVTHIISHNARNYYNPLSARFEPVYYDGYVSKLKEENSWAIGAYIPHYMKEKDHLSFLRLLFKNIRTLTAKSFAQALKEKDQEYIKTQLSIIHTHFPEYEFDWDLIMDNIKLLRSYFWEYTPDNAFRAFSHESHLNKNSSLLRIWISNYTARPIEVLKAEYRHNNNASIPLAIINKKSDLLCDPISCLVKRSDERKITEYRHFDIKVPLALSKASLNINNFKIIYRYLGAEKQHSLPIYRRIYYDKEKLLKAKDYSNANIESQIQKHPFLILSKRKKTLSFKTGSWRVKEDIRIPRGYQVFIPGGTLLRFAQSAAFISHSPLRIQGSRSRPAIFKALKNSWEGLIVYGAREQGGKLSPKRNSKGRSIIKALIIKDARGLRRPGLQLTGGVTFYKTAVDIIDCSFLNSKGEDMLNIINSQFTINSSRFENAFSDALDSDFSTGMIWNTSFTNIKGDALDFSGSNVKLQSIRAAQVGDKFISVGEKSSISGKKIKVKKAKYALAVKDSSKLELFKDIHLEQIEIALLSFQKKPEYGSAELIVQDIIFKNVKEKYWLEKGSSIKLEGKELEPNKENMADILYPQEDKP